MWARSCWGEEWIGGKEDESSYFLTGKCRGQYNGLFLVSWSRPCMMFVYSSRIFSESKDWGYASTNLFKIRPWHKASLPIPFNCPPAINIFFNDSYDVSFVDVQFIHVLKGDEKGNVVNLSIQEGPTILVGFLFFTPVFHQESVSGLLIGNEPEIPNSGGLSTYWAAYFLKILKMFPSLPVVSSWATCFIMREGWKGLNMTVSNQPAMNLPYSTAVAQLNSERLNS